MAQGVIKTIRGNLEEAFIYEGERVAIEYPDGTSYEIPPHKVHAVLFSSLLPDGEECMILPEKSPVTRLPLVILD